MLAPTSSPLKHSADSARSCFRFGVTDKREPGDIGWGKRFLSTDKAAADKMRLKEV